MEAHALASVDQSVNLVQHPDFAARFGHRQKQLRRFD
jgi:hypothetical protein